MDSGAYKKRGQSQFNYRREGFDCLTVSQKEVRNYIWRTSRSGKMFTRKEKMSACKYVWHATCKFFSCSGGKVFRVSFVACVRLWSNVSNPWQLFGHLALSFHQCFALLKEGANPYHSWPCGFPQRLFLAAAQAVLMAVAGNSSYNL